jgi:hypothetical protein
MSTPHLALFLAALSMCISASALRAADARTTEGVSRDFLKTIVSIEEMTVIGGTNSFKSIGTGFLLQTPDNLMALVTAKHVITNRDGVVRANLGYRLNSKSGASMVILDELARKTAGPWVASREEDVALRFIVFDLENSDIKGFDPKMLLRRNAVLPGAHVFVLGYPLGLRSEAYAVPILRTGSVARAEGGVFLVEAFCFPGNSGGPVIYTPNIHVEGASGSSTITEVKIIGLVANQLIENETYVSPKTGNVRINFEQPLGLTEVTPADGILNLLEGPEATKLAQKIKEGK